MKVVVGLGSKTRYPYPSLTAMDAKRGAYTGFGSIDVNILPSMVTLPRPGWRPVLGEVVGESGLAGAVGIHHVYLTIAVGSDVEAIRVPSGDQAG